MSFEGHDISPLRAIQDEDTRTAWSTYYKADYFESDEAGPDMKQEVVIQEIRGPERIAAIIRADIVVLP